MRKWISSVLLAMAPLACQEAAPSIETAAMQTPAPAAATDRPLVRPRDVPPPEAAAMELPTGVLDLAQARALALEANPDLHASVARLEAALTRIAEAKSFYFPQIALAHTSNRTLLAPDQLSRFPQSIQSQFVLPELTPNPSLIDLFNMFLKQLPRRSSLSTANQNSFSDHSSALTATWLLFDGFAREARLLGVKHAHRAAEMSVSDMRRLVIRAIEAAYYQGQLGREQLRIAQADEAFSNEQLAIAQRWLEAKKVTKAGVLNFELRVRAAQAEAIAAMALMETAKVLMAELMALPGARLPDDVELAPLEPEAPDEMTPPVEDVWVDTAMAARPDLVAAQYVLKAQAENIRLAKGEYSPELSLRGSWGFQKVSNMGYSDDDQAAAVGVEMRWSIYSGGFRTAQVRRAEAGWREASAALEQKRLEVASDVRRAVVALREAQQQIELQRLNLDAARENRTLVEREYVAGKASLVRLNEAQRDYVRTDGDLAQARVRLRRAWSELAAAANAYPEVSLPDASSVQ